MMDCLMIGIILAGFGVVKLLASWCQRQVESEE